MVTHANAKRARRWGVGIAGTVMSGVILTGVIAIPKAMLAQAHTNTQLVDRVAYLTDQIKDLRGQLAGIPGLRDRVTVNEADMRNMKQQIARLESKSP